MCYHHSLDSASTHLAHVVHLERKGRIEEAVVRFWVAELAEALNYLRKQRIIHRYALTSHTLGQPLIPIQGPQARQHSSRRCGSCAYNRLQCRDTLLRTSATHQRRGQHGVHGTRGGGAERLHLVCRLVEFGSGDVGTALSPATIRRADRREDDELDTEGPPQAPE